MDEQKVFQPVASEIAHDGAGILQDAILMCNKVVVNRDAR